MAVITGTIHDAATVDVNAGITADVEPAVAAASGLRYLGLSIRESDGTPAVATVKIYNGATVAGGTEIDIVELAANGSDEHWFWPGIDAADGISIEVIAGTVDVNVYHNTVNP
tara:strand:+ start:291 stop:629 length:339 start_codon:yes stop_codon:yes gene_type:complete